MTKSIHNPTTDDRFDINDLVQKAKKKGSLDSEEIIEAIEACGLSDEDAEKVYQKLYELGIEVTVTDFSDDIPDFENFEDDDEELEKTIDKAICAANKTMFINFNFFKYNISFSCIRHKSHLLGYNRNYILSSKYLTVF